MKFVLMDFLKLHDLSKLKFILKKQTLDYQIQLIYLGY